MIRYRGALEEQGRAGSAGAAFAVWAAAELKVVGAVLPMLEVGGILAPPRPCRGGGAGAAAQPPAGGEVMDGIDCGIDAIGFQARDFDQPQHEQPRFDQLSRLVNPTGRLGIIGVFPAEDPQAAGELERRGHLDVPWGRLFSKGVTIGMGRDHDKRYNDFLRDLIASGRIRPSAIVSHRLPLADAADAYRRFDERRDGYIKVVLNPAWT